MLQALVALHQWLSPNLMFIGLLIVVVPLALKRLAPFVIVIFALFNQKINDRLVKLIEVTKK